MKRANNPEQTHVFDGVSIRPLDRLAHLVHKHGDTFSESDLDGFSTALETEVHQVREFVAVLCDVYQNSPCLDYSLKIDEQDLRYHYSSLLTALCTAINKLSEFADLSLACAYASNEIASRLSTLKGGKV